MSLRWMIRYCIGLLLGLLLSALMFAMVISRADNRRLPEDAGEFLRAVDLSPLDRAAVHSEGRIKSFDSFAQEMLGFVAGPKRIAGLPPDLAYLDMLFRSERYEDAPIIYVKNESMRGQLAAAILADATEAQRDAYTTRMETFRRTGLISRAMLKAESIQELMQRWSLDIVRTAKHVNSIQAGINMSQPTALMGMLDLIPPPDGNPNSPWINIASLWSRDQQFQAPGSDRLDAAKPELAREIRDSFSALVSSWQQEDAQGVNAALVEFCALLPQSAPSLYPSTTQMAMESWYFKSSRLTWGWLIYLVSLILLLMAVVYRWETARALGMGVFTSAFALHTVALAWRWYVSGRWPNSNMFEAVTTSVWLGALIAIGVEIAARRSALRNLFALGAAGASMCGLMAAHYLPQLNPSINNMMPVLHDLWLYIHTNVIIASYALIAMAAVTATLYLLRRIIGGSPDYARVGGAGLLVEGSTEHEGARGTTLGEVFDGATMILMELSFVMLWAGLVMGAIWADHSWGRPWGWDPKEVFALNTFLVFLVLVHVRLKVRDKGLWTAVLAIIGCGVMLFNWIVINFVISGLHSYA